ncbi:MAG TPA: hypothetical protein VJ301_03980 [Propionibacteriaceae bacterium]|nr:hypothetical protein [Propionibacteriaceae bacterium]
MLPPDFLLDTHVGMHIGGGATRSSDAIDRLITGCVDNVIHNYCRAASRHILSDRPATPLASAVTSTTLAAAFATIEPSFTVWWITGMRFSVPPLGGERLSGLNLVVF